MSSMNALKITALAWSLISCGSCGIWKSPQRIYLNAPARVCEQYSTITSQELCETIQYPVQRQPVKNSCWPKNIQLVLQSLGVEVPIETIYDKTWFSQWDKGVLPHKLVRALNALQDEMHFSLKTVIKWSKLKHMVGCGRRCIVLIKSPRGSLHYATVTDIEHTDWQDRSEATITMIDTNSELSNTDAWAVIELRWSGFMGSVFRGFVIVGVGK